MRAKSGTTGSTSRWNTLLDKQTIEDAAIELGVDASFVEKDWYAVQVLKAIADFSHSSITPIFSGGTSLSKGYGLLKRFSEDLDFRALFEGEDRPNKKVRRGFRKGIFDAIKSIDGIGLDESQMEAGSNFFKIPLSYPKLFDVPSSLRSDLQLEFSYTQPRCEAESKPIVSIVSELGGEAPSFEIPCLICIETAADKFSALVWRVIKRDRASEDDDPAMIRHLHDLYALKDMVGGQVDEFKRLVKSSYAEDMRSGPRKLDKGLSESTKEALSILQADEVYQEEYAVFVAKVSYADEVDKIQFEMALEHLKELIALVE